MPTRLALEFPVPGGEFITFVCDSGDYDDPIELDRAINQVNVAMADFTLDDRVGFITLENC